MYLKLILECEVVRRGYAGNLAVTKEGMYWEH